MEKISEDIIKDVEDLIDIDKEKSRSKETSIIFDGRQYSIKIPKDIAESVRINPDDKIVFNIQKHPIEEQKAPELTMKLKRANE